MKKSTFNHVIPLLGLVVSAALITACEKGGPRTPEGAVERKRCERGFETAIENQKTVDALKTNSQVDGEVAIRTFVMNFKHEKDQPSLLNPNNTEIVLAQNAEVFASHAEASHAVVIEKDCKNLKASIRVLGTEIRDLDIKSTSLLSIELVSKNQETGEEINIKVEKAARLTSYGKEISNQLEAKGKIPNKNDLKSKLKAVQESQVAKGNIVMTVSIDVKGLHGQSYKIEQHSGDLSDDFKVDFDPTVLEMIAERTLNVGVPESVRTALQVKSPEIYEKLSGSFAKVDKSTRAAGENVLEQTDALSGGKLTAEKPEAGDGKIDELNVITEVREKLETAAGLAAAGLQKSGETKETAPAAQTSAPTLQNKEVTSAEAQPTQSKEQPKS